MTIDYRTLTEDTLFTATRAIRGHLHELGVIEAGEVVFFRANREADVGEPDGSFTLCYEDGRPTNGNQYRTLADWQSVRAFVEGSGLTPVDRPCAHYVAYGEHAWTNDVDRDMHCVECGLVMRDAK